MRSSMRTLVQRTGIFGRCCRDLLCAVRTVRCRDSSGRPRRRRCSARGRRAARAVRSAAEASARPRRCSPCCLSCETSARNSCEISAARSPAGRESSYRSFCSSASRCLSPTNRRTSPGGGSATRRAVSSPRPGDAPYPGRGLVAARRKCPPRCRLVHHHLPTTRGCNPEKFKLN